MTDKKNNSGDHNSGNYNSGSRNSGNRNSGHYNSGDSNSGHFNNTTPKDILVFGKPCDRELFDNFNKPNFLFFDITKWVREENMTQDEKDDNTSFKITGGYLKKYDYKEAFKKSWDKADKEDRIRIKDMPNFDKEIFKDISGIDVDEDNDKEIKKLELEKQLEEIKQKIKEL